MSRRPNLAFWATLLMLIGIAALATIGSFAQGAEYLPDCHSALPKPPLIVVLPDGTEVPANEITYDLASRRVIVVGNPRLFCDGFEGP